MDLQEIGHIVGSSLLDEMTCMVGPYPYASPWGDPYLIVIAEPPVGEDTLMAQALIDISQVERPEFEHICHEIVTHIRSESLLASTGLGDTYEAWEGLSDPEAF